jgi:hypothetical protein
LSASNVSGMMPWPPYGVALLIQDAAVAFNCYLLGLGQDKLAAFVALNFGIAAATLFRFWSYRLLVWRASPAGAR